MADTANAGVVAGNNFNGSGMTGYTAPSTTPNTTAQSVNVQSTPDMQVGTNQTVSGQLNGLIASNSPYMQLARSNAMQTANDRGLINSSMAAGAGESAAISAALPIAQQDAQTSQATALANFNAKQSDASQNATAANQANLANLNASTTLQNTAMNNATALQQTNMSTSAQSAIAAGQAAMQQLNTNSSAANNLFNTYQQEITQIEQNTSMDANAKSQAMNNLQQQFAAQIQAMNKATPGIPDVSTYLSNLNFGTSGSASTAVPNYGTTSAVTAPAAAPAPAPAPSTSNFWAQQADGER